MTQTRYNGISGVTGREPVGAVLRIGKKGPKGAPTDRDRFYICQPRADSSKSRPLDPRFSSFNESKALAWRRDIDGVLVHSDEDDAWSRQLICYKPNGAPRAPSSRPFCVGDGVKATRWNPNAGDDGEFVSIPCPNKACQYRQKSRARDGCKPHLTLLFRPTWHEGSSLPTPLMRLDSRSWNSVANFEGFFDRLREDLDALIAQGVIDSYPNLHGFPFRLQLRENTSSGDGGRRFPVLMLTPTESVSSWLIRTAADRDVIKASFEGLKSIPDDENVSNLVEVDPFLQRRVSSPASDGAK